MCLIYVISVYHLEIHPHMGGGDIKGIVHG